MSSTLRKRKKTRIPKDGSMPKTGNVASDSDDTTPKKWVLAAACAVAIASVGIYWLLSKLGYCDNRTHSTVRSKEDENKGASQFLEWFHKNGGWMSPQVELSFFPQYGYGLLALGATNDEIAIIQGDQLLKVPESIQFSEKSAIYRFRQLHRAGTISDKMSKSFPDPLERQDAMIGLSLMVECSLASESFFYPYLDILPQHVPRLDTFGDAQLKLLQDDSLEMLAKQSRVRLLSTYNLIRGDIEALAKEAAAKSRIEIDDSCLSFDSFHRFVAIASSHAMILAGTKHLVPMADMINHDSRPEDNQEYSFSTFHRRDSTSGDISVHADRSILANNQVFEEYGKLDNSLYLVAHGFVPESNPYHCAILPARVLPPVTHPKLLEALKWVHFTPDILDNVCVQSNFAIVGYDDNAVAAYLAVSSLERSNEVHLDECIQSLQSDNQGLIQSSCIKYPSSKAAIKGKIQESAATLLAQTETTLEEDLALLEESIERKDHVSTILALGFRIADKQVLATLSRDGVS